MSSSDSKIDFDQENGNGDRDKLLNQQPIASDFSYGTWQEPETPVEKKTTYCVNSSLGISCLVVAGISLTLLIVALIVI